MSVLEELLDKIPVPRVYRVRHAFERPRVADIAADLEAALASRNVLSAVRRGRRIAITVGSRGVANQTEVVRLLAARLSERGALPFVVPAMGSHGGATAEGQRALLENAGITEQTVGCPIVSSMQTVRIGTSENGLPVHIDKNAHEADGIVVLNRVKQHPGFRGPYESGLMKMLAIGLGKQYGASICHDLGFGHMAENIPAIARVMLRNAGVVFGVALIENAYHETARIAVLRPDEFADEEPKLLDEARRLSPHLGFAQLDVLVVDEIGKNIAGTGFDTNIVGRYHTPYASGGPAISRVVVLDLTGETHGNANGIGIVDFTTRRVFEKMDFDQTYPNSLTSTVPASVKIPMVLPNDRMAIQAAVRTCNVLDKTRVRLVRITNTLRIDELEVSESLRDEVSSAAGFTTMSEPYALPFDRHGNLR